MHFCLFSADNTIQLNIKQKSRDTKASPTMSTSARDYNYLCLTEYCCDEPLVVGPADISMHPIETYGKLRTPANWLCVKLSSVTVLPIDSIRTTTSLAGLPTKGRYTSVQAQQANLAELSARRGLRTTAIHFELSTLLSRHCAR